MSKSHAYRWKTYHMLNSGGELKRSWTGGSRWKLTMEAKRIREEERQWMKENE